MNRRHACATLAAGAAVLATACMPRGPLIGRDAPGASLLISGAGAMQQLATALADAFRRGRRGLAIQVERGGSLPAYIAASRGAIDVAAMTRPLSDVEDRAGVRHHLVARDAVGIVVHPSLPVKDLRRDQVRALLSGEVVNWRALGGPDLAVSVLVLPRGATARQSAESLVLDGDEFAVDAHECASAAALAAAVAATPGAIACLDGRDRRGLDRAGAAAFALLAVDGVAPTLASVLSGRYPYTEGFHLLLYGAAQAPDDSSGAFVRYARSAAGQAIVERLGFVAVC